MECGVFTFDDCNIDHTLLCCLLQTLFFVQHPSIEAGKGVSCEEVEAFARGRKRCTVHKMGCSTGRTAKEDPVHQ